MAVIAAVLGVVLIVRRQSLLADTLSHVSLVGVALSMLFQFSPTWMTIVVVCIAAVGIEYLRKVYKGYSEVSIAILMSAGLATALVLMSVKQTGSPIKMEHYLFGSLVTVSSEQLMVLMILTLVVVVLYIIFRRVIYMVLLDEDTAKVEGIPVEWVSALMTLMMGVIISVLIPISGSLLVASILILPTSIAMRVTKTFSSVMLVGGLVSLLGMSSGLVVSYEYSTPPGATITLIFVSFFILQSGLLFVIKRIRNKR